MVWQALLVDLVMLAVFICMLVVIARWVHFRIVFFVKREILNRLHHIALSKMNDCLDIVNQALMLDLSWLIDTLLNLDRILVDLCSQFICYLYFLMSLGDVVLENQEHRFVTLQEYLILMDVHISGWHCMLSYVSSIDYTEGIFGKNSLIQSFDRRLNYFTFCLFLTVLGVWYYIIIRLCFNILLHLKYLCCIFKSKFNEGNDGPCWCWLLQFK